MTTSAVREKERLKKKFDGNLIRFLALARLARSPLDRNNQSNSKKKKKKKKKTFRPRDPLGRRCRPARSSRWGLPQGVLREGGSGDSRCRQVRREREKRKELEGGRSEKREAIAEDDDDLKLPPFLFFFPFLSQPLPSPPLPPDPSHPHELKTTTTTNKTASPPPPSSTRPPTSSSTSPPSARPSSRRCRL